MKRVGMVTLITERPEARGILEQTTEIRRRTYCEERSLSLTEVYQARASGFIPSIRLALPQDFEYRGETVCEYRGERYNIIRDYRDEKSGTGTELTLERVRGNAAKPIPAAETPTGGTETPTGGTETPTEGTETPAEGTETPTEGTETPAEGPEAPAGTEGDTP